MNKAQKLVQMVELVRRAGGVRADELSSRFDLDARSLRRYLADLREIGVPLVDEGRSEQRVISVEPRWRRTGVQLSLAEVLSLHFGRTLFTFLDGTTFVQDMDDAIERLEPAISRTHAELSRELDRKFVAVPEHAKSYTGETSEVIDDLVTALVFNNPVEVRYTKAAGTSSHYRLEPYTLAIYRQGLYVFARDARADQVKTFAVERITEIARVWNDKFVVPADWDPRAHLATAFGIIPGDPEEVRLAFSPDVRTYVRERLWHASQELRQLPDGWLELTLQVAVNVELVNWIHSFGPDARVLGPPHLVERVRADLVRTMARYADAG
ncbi:MAG: WYL domain-containing transcriptional regulator [Alphaproteobacteria bacterium]|nr:WYL domain-containing transcriptional regulator [Alphaproteobacteria bacterium]